MKLLSKIKQVEDYDYSHLWWTSRVGHFHILLTVKDITELGYSESRQTLDGWDRHYVWHPFTFQKEWLEHEAPIIVRGDGPYLYDADGRELIDGNSSIWCNIHGHGHPRLIGAMRDQLERFAHSSFLGYSHPPGIVLSRRLIEEHLGKWGFTRVFFNESGANAIEAGLRMALQWQSLRGNPEKRRIVAFHQSYHGDSLGAVSVTGLASFKKHLGETGYEVVRIATMEELETRVDPAGVAAVIYEPVIAGAAGMHPWPEGMMRRCRAWCDTHEALMIHDEILTGFGRTGTMFGFEQEECPADILCLGKALSAGTSPLSATIATDRVFEPYRRAEKREDSLLYGHTYAGHALGCAAAIASLDVFAEEQVLAGLPEKISVLREELEKIGRLPQVAEIRRRGLISAVEVASDPLAPEMPAYERNRGHHVVAHCWRLGLITRSIGNTIIFLPPLCSSPEVIRKGVGILREAVEAS